MCSRSTYAIWYHVGEKVNLEKRSGSLTAVRLVVASERAGAAAVVTAVPLSDLLLFDSAVRRVSVRC